MDIDTVPIIAPDRLFIGGQWVEPLSGRKIEVIRPDSEEQYFLVAEADEADVGAAVAAARCAFDEGPWPQTAPAERADVLVQISEILQERAGDIANIWSSEVGVLHSAAQAAAPGMAGTFRYYARLGRETPFLQIRKPRSGGKAAALALEPVGVAGVIVPWNNAGAILANKVAPALLSGCTVVVKSSPEAPGEAYILAEAAEKVGLPPGVLNVVTADRTASEALVRDGRVDKIAFTGSTVVGRHIGAICAQRVARLTLELGGKSAAVVFDDYDVELAARTLAESEVFLSGQVCASVTRIIVTEARHDRMAEALAAFFARIKVGSQFDPDVQMGPLVSARQRDRVERYVQAGKEGGATLVTGGSRPSELDRGFFFEPTVFAGVDNNSTIGSEEIFGPVLCVIPARDEADALDIANDTIYGLNAAVFTDDADKALAAARRLRCGTVSHNAVRADYSIGFGGFKQSGVGREGGAPGLDAFVETKTIVLDGEPVALAPIDQ